MLRHGSISMGRQGVCMMAAMAAAIAASAGSGVLLDVPFLSQPRNGCGAASIAMVMQYWDKNLGRAPSAREDVTMIQRALYSKQAKGIFASAMERYLRDAGYRTFAIHGEWSDLRENLEKGRPLIVGLAPQGPHDPLHFVVVAGMDWQNDWIFLNDPAQRKLLKMGRAEFAQQWAATQHWTLLAVP
ncbi:MAG TPA: C39 family peptidase [Candidatus Cybelea sp.]|nr:C39 family peptidase [Candidatus Cybelea sp.]